MLVTFIVQSPDLVAPIGTSHFIPRNNLRVITLPAPKPTRKSVRLSFFQLVLDSTSACTNHRLAGK
jgi:hypothetical protein